MSTLDISNFDKIFFIFAGNKDNHLILEGSKFSKTQADSVELAALERLKKIPLYLYLEKYSEHSSAFTFGWILIILTGNKDNYKSLDEFEFLPDPITNY